MPYYALLICHILYLIPMVVVFALRGCNRLHRRSAGSSRDSLSETQAMPSSALAAAPPAEIAPQPMSAAARRRPGLGLWPLPGTMR